jgi:hypothetical protein
LLRPSGSLRLAAGEEGRCPEPGGESVRLGYPTPRETLVMTARRIDAAAQPTDLELQLSRARDGHVFIILGRDTTADSFDDDLLPVPTPAWSAAAEVLHRLIEDLRKDLTATQLVHNCPRTQNSPGHCHAIDNTHDGSTVAFSVPTNRLPGWLDVIGWQLVEIGPPDLAAASEGSRP